VNTLFSEAESSAAILIAHGTPCVLRGGGIPKTEGLKFEAKGR